MKKPVFVAKEGARIVGVFDNLAVAKDSVEKTHERTRGDKVWSPGGMFCRFWVFYINDHEVSRILEAPFFTECTTM